MHARNTRRSIFLHAENQLSVCVFSTATAKNKVGNLFCTIARTIFGKEEYAIFSSLADETGLSLTQAKILNQPYKMIKHMNYL